MARGEDLSYSGDLQAGVMAALWELGEAKVEEVRRQLPEDQRSAYTTLQTVMNRLVERGLLQRRRRGSAFLYKAKYNEAEVLARTLGERLADASPKARRTALINLVDELDADDLDEVARYAARIRRARKDGDG